jgi:hypothetical protein
VIGYIFSRFGILFQDKYGNPRWSPLTRILENERTILHGIPADDHVSTDICIHMYISKQRHVWRKSEIQLMPLFSRRAASQSVWGDLKSYIGPVIHRLSPLSPVYVPTFLIVLYVHTYIHMYILINAKLSPQIEQSMTNSFRTCSESQSYDFWIYSYNASVVVD